MRKVEIGKALTGAVFGSQGEGVGDGYPKLHLRDVSIRYASVTV